MGETLKPRYKLLELDIGEEACCWTDDELLGRGSRSIELSRTAGMFDGQGESVRKVNKQWQTSGPCRTEIRTLQPASSSNWVHLAAHFL